MLKLFGVHSPDVEVGRPASDPEDVYFLLQCEIGMADDIRCDVFDVMIATPRGLLRSSRPLLISSRGLIVIRRFTWSDINDEIDRILKECWGGRWIESVFVLRRYFLHEYENYK